MNTALLLTLLAGGLAGCSHNCYDRSAGCSSGSSSTGVSKIPVATTGKVADGYVSGATVTLDLNDNGNCDTGEPTTTTDGNGNYSFPAADDQHMVCVTGGTDSGTGLALVGTLKTPAGASVVTPLTSIVTSAGTANAAAIASKLGLAGVDLLHTDPVAVIATTPTLIQTTAAMQTLMVQATSSIQAAGGFGTAAQGNVETVALYDDTVKAAGTTLLGLAAPLTTTTLGSIAGNVVTQATLNAQGGASASLRAVQFATAPVTVSVSTGTQLATALKPISAASMGNFIGAIIAAMTDAVAAAPASSLNTPGPGNPFALLVANISSANTVGALAKILLTSANLISAADLQAIANAALPISADGSPVTGSASDILSAIATNATSVTIPPSLAASLTASLNSVNNLANAVTVSFACDSGCSSVNSTPTAQLSPVGSFATLTQANGAKLGAISLTFGTPSGNPVVNGVAVSSDVTGDSTAVATTEQTSSIYISVLPNVGDTDLKEALNLRIDGVVFYMDTNNLVEGFIPAGATATVSGALQDGSSVSATLSSSGLKGAITFTHGTSSAPTMVSLNLPALLTSLGSGSLNHMGMLSALNGAVDNQQFKVTLTAPGLQIQSNIYSQFIPGLIANVVWSPKITPAITPVIVSQVQTVATTDNFITTGPVAFQPSPVQTISPPLLTGAFSSIRITIVVLGNTIYITLDVSGHITTSIIYIS